MSDKTSFLSFCEYIVSNIDDKMDLYSLGEVYLNFIEPYAVENDIVLPDEFTELMDDILESMEDDIQNEHEEDNEELLSSCDESQIDSDDDNTTDDNKNNEF